MKICAWCGERASYQFVRFDTGTASYPASGQFCSRCMWDADVTKPNLPLYRRLRDDVG